MKYLTACLVATTIALVLVGQSEAKSTKESQRKRIKFNDPNRVINGTNVQDGGAPHQVAIFQNGFFICGGSLIGPQSVLTGATCVYQYV